jgi:prepilin-type N-terminal cleavage/methylation domain-containing protein
LISLLRINRWYLKPNTASIKYQLKLPISKSERGFTIIEVLIVLAIAGLILLIVFLAVPALQRNSRNTQYRTEGARILAVTQEFINNGGGTLPTCATFPCNSGTAGTDPAKIVALANLKNITTLNMQQAAGNLTALTPTLTTAQLETGVVCGPTGGATVTPGAGPTRSIILVYAVENADGSVNAQCTAS